MRILIGLSLLVCLFGLSEGAEASDKPVPSDRVTMERFMGLSMASGNFAMLKRIREELPQFSYVPDPIGDYEPIFGANKTIDLIAHDADEAVAGIHDLRTGEILFACTLPCTAEVNGQTDYLVSMLSIGRVPHMSVLSASHPPGDPFGSYLGVDMIDHAGKAGDCWTGHEASGFPDTEPTPCVRMPARMPLNATRSGHCRLQFDVLATGWVANAQALSCTEPMFEVPALAAMNWWYYIPLTQRGQTLPAIAVETKMTFRLVDEVGRLIDENGVVQPD